jgi:hypothetical protein
MNIKMQDTSITLGGQTAEDIDGLIADNLRNWEFEIEARDGHQMRADNLSKQRTALREHQLEILRKEVGPKKAAS